MEENIERIYRHGDVIIFKLKQEPEKIVKRTEVKTLTLALGEVTGHKHVLTGNILELETEEKADGKYFEVLSASALTHEEHNTIVLEKGCYLKVDQVEYNPFSHLLQKIAD